MLNCDHIVLRLQKISIKVSSVFTDDLTFLELGVHSSNIVYT